MPDFWDRNDVKAALGQVPEGQRGVYRALIESNSGHQYQDHVPEGGRPVEIELERAREALARLHPTAPAAADKPAVASPEARDAAIRALIEKRHGVPGQRTLYSTIAKHWDTTARELFPPQRNTADHPDALAGKTPAMGSVDKLIQASRTAPPAADKPVDPRLIQPRQPITREVDPRSVLPRDSKATKGPPITVSDPLAKLRQANALRSDSSISQAIREYSQASQAIKIAPTRELRAVAEARRDTAAQRIHQLGYTIPKAA